MGWKNGLMRRLHLNHIYMYIYKRFRAFYPTYRKPVPNIFLYTYIYVCITRDEDESSIVFKEARGSPKPGGVFGSSAVHEEGILAAVRREGMEKLLYWTAQRRLWGEKSGDNTSVSGVG